MSKEWKVYHRIYDEDTGDFYEDEYDVVELDEKGLLEYAGSNPEIQAMYFAFKEFCEEESFLRHLSNYSTERLQKLMSLFCSFHQFEKALLVGKEGLKRFPEDPNLIAFCLKAASYCDRGRDGQQFFLKLINNVPRDQLSAEGYQAVIRFLYPTIKRDEELCRELLRDYYLNYPADQRATLLQYEIEHMLGNEEAALTVLRQAITVHFDAYYVAKQLFLAQMQHGQFEAAEETAWYGYHAVHLAKEWPGDSMAAFFTFALIQVEAFKLFRRGQYRQDVTGDVKLLIEKCLRFERDYVQEVELTGRAASLRKQLAALAIEDMGPQGSFHGASQTWQDKDPNQMVLP